MFTDWNKQHYIGKENVIQHCEHCQKFKFIEIHILNIYTVLFVWYWFKRDITCRWSHDKQLLSRNSFCSNRFNAYLYRIQMHNILLCCLLLFWQVSKFYNGYLICQRYAICVHINKICLYDIIVLQNIEKCSRKTKIKCTRAPPLTIYSFVVKFKDTCMLLSLSLEMKITFDRHRLIMSDNFDGR